MPRSLFCKEQDRGLLMRASRGSTFSKEITSGPCYGDLRDCVLEVASTCATESEAVNVLPSSLSETWKRDFEAFNISSFTPLDLERFQFDHIIRPAADGLHAQIEVHIDHVAGTKVVGKRFPRAYLRDSPAEFRESDSFCGEDPWTEMFLAAHLGQGATRVRGVLPCYGIFTDERGDVLLMMEYAPSGDVFELASCLGEPGPGREAKAAQVLCSLLEGVKRLHCLGIAHRDISAENAIVRSDGGDLEVALLDFAMAVHDRDLHNVTGANGKLMYRPPESVAEDAVYDARAADLFACGVVGYALAIGNYPWQSTAGGCKAFDYVKNNGFLRFLQKRTIPVGSNKVPVADVLSPGFQAVLVALLDLDPARRHDLSEMFLKV